MFKLLRRLILKRLVPFLEIQGLIPEQQHAYREGRSTSTACETLLNDIRNALDRPPHHLHAIFIDFSLASDSGSRSIALAKLAQGGVPTKLLHLLRAFLQENRNDIDDGVTITRGLVQANGFAQGENTSPILFSVLTGELPKTITSKHPLVNIVNGLSMSAGFGSHSGPPVG